MENFRYQKLIREMYEGKCIMIDGATATELERRGVPQLKNAWNGGGALSHPNTLKEIHKEYVALGARVIITNTFATCKHTLEDAEQGHNFEDLNSKAVMIARQACEELKSTETLIAGGISYWSFTGNSPSLKVLGENIYEQALIHKNSGVDLLMLEMMVDIDRMLVTLEAAKKSSLPVWVGLSCTRNLNGSISLLNGSSLKAAILELKDKEIDLINIMHTEIPYVSTCLDILKSNWGGLIGVYAHSGKMKNTKWTFNSIISPKEYSKQASIWIEKGINLIGGCCGITTEHMRYIAGKNFKND